MDNEKLIKAENLNHRINGIKIITVSYTHLTLPTT